MTQGRLVSEERLKDGSSAPRLHQHPPPPRVHAAREDDHTPPLGSVRSVSPTILSLLKLINPSHNSFFFPKYG